MARVGNNIITIGLQGKVGNLIFRRRGEKTSTYVMSPRKKALSKGQTEAQLRFSAAVKLARAAINDPVEREKFAKMARKMKKESAYTAAVSYFMSKKT